MEKIQTAVALMQTDEVQTKLNQLMGAKSKGFLTSVMGVLSSNTNLSKCEPQSVYMAVMMAAALDLPINQNLGFAYIIPYGNKAQFQIGYKGLIQLAQRTGLFKTISATKVYEGQLLTQDPLKGFTFDWDAKSSDKVTGYAAYFSLLNGFEKTLYMTADEVNLHGKVYSKTFSSQFGTWKSNFDAMALKTVLKLLLGKYAPLSIEMQKATVADQAVINDADTMDVTYVDNEPEVTPEQPTQLEAESDRFLQLINGANSPDMLNKLRKELKKYPEHNLAFLDKETDLEKGITANV